MTISRRHGEFTTNKQITTKLKCKIDLSNHSYNDSPDEELTNALMSLGYTPTEIRKVVLNMDHSDSITLEDKVRSALNNLSNSDT